MAVELAKKLFQRKGYLQYRKIIFPLIFIMVALMAHLIMTEIIILSAVEIVMIKMQALILMLQKFVMVLMIIVIMKQMKALMKMNASILVKMKDIIGLAMDKI